MSQAFDYNGTVVAPSVPKKVLRTEKKVVHIDSADREQVKYYTNGDFVVYLPRKFTNVVSLRLMGAEFPPIVPGFNSAPSARQHSYFASATNSGGFNLPTASYVGDSTVTTDNYFLIDIEGLSKVDECAVNGIRSTFPDGFFAKIPAVIMSRGNSGAPSSMISYSDKMYQENIARFVEQRRKKLSEAGSHAKRITKEHQSYQWQQALAATKQAVGKVPPEVDQKALQIVQQEFTPEDLPKLADARLLKLVIEAAHWRTLQESKPSLNKRASEAKAVKPVGRSAPQAQIAGKAALARQQLKKTGDSNAAEAYLESLFSRRK